MQRLPSATAATKSEPVERSEELLTAVTEFCREALGRSVLGLTELKDKLLLKQSSLGGTHPLCGGGVGDIVLVEAVRTCGGLELMSGGGGRTLYALTHGEKVLLLAVD